MLTLVVDDYPDSADSIALALEYAGIQSIAVTDGQSALAAIERHKPQAAIIDLKLESLDGFQIAQFFRASPSPTVNTATLIAYTGLQSEQYRVQAREAGFDFYILKPCDPAYLCACLGCDHIPDAWRHPLPQIDHARLTALSKRSHAALSRAQDLVARYRSFFQR